MAKEQYWFKHDSNAQDDPKCMQLIEDLGMEGYGIYWALIERLRSEEDYSLPVSAYKPLARRLNTGDKKIQAVVEAFGLFEIENDRFYSKSLRGRMEYNRKRAADAAAARWGIESEKKAAKLLEMSSAVDASALHLDELSIAQVCLREENRKEENRIEEIREDKKKKSSIPSKQVSPDAEKFSEWFKTIASPATVKNLRPTVKRDWEETYDWLIGRDYTKEQIVAACKWARSDSFWADNFLSASKLKKLNKEGIRYIDLFLEKMQREATAKPKKAPDNPNESDIPIVGWKYNAVTGKYMRPREEYGNN
jgi:hypothetical protein